MPKVSVCMPTYNRAGHLAKTLPTVLGQTFADFELIISDDNSGDGTEQVVRAANDDRIVYLRNAANLRMPANLNNAIRRAKGEYIAVFHDHDLYAPTLLAEMASFLDRHPNAGFVHTGIYWLNEDTGAKKDLTSDWEEITPGPKMLRNLLSRWDCPICALTMARKSCYDALGLYDEKYGFISDVDMWMRFSSKYDVGYIAKPLITCLEREREHVYSRFNWDIPVLILRTHAVNLERLAEYNFFVHLLFRLRFALRKNILLMRNQLYVCAKKDTANINRGLEVIKNEGSAFIYFMAIVFSAVARHAK